MAGREKGKRKRPDYLGAWNRLWGFIILSLETRACFPRASQGQCDFLFAINLSSLVDVRFDVIKSSDVKVHYGFPGNRLPSMTKWWVTSAGNGLSRFILAKSLYGVFPVPLGQFVSVTYARRTGGHRSRDLKRFGREQKWGLGTRQVLFLKSWWVLSRGRITNETLQVRERTSTWNSAWAMAQRSQRCQQETEATATYSNHKCVQRQQQNTTITDCNSLNFIGLLRVVITPFRS